MYEIFAKLMADRNLTPYKVAKETGITQATLSRWKTGKVNPSIETLQILADYFGVTLDYLTGNEPQQQEMPALTKKDERDIAKKLNETLDLLENAQDGLMFDGEPLDDETKELLRMSLKNQYEMTKKLAKQKFTPKKYR